ncbi:MAG: zinc ABC transporter solute-binding protein [Desulfobacteraceae bacterium]|nr:zinc ABC transporter solute-binding protein [Desulfobacteraceae bacterium]
MKAFLNKLTVISLLMLSFAQPGIAKERVSVFASIVPQKYFIQQIGKDLVDVQAMVQPGASPAAYEPNPGQMAALSKAKIYFAIGVPFERTWLKKIAAANPKMQVVHTDHAIEKIPIAARHHHDKNEHHEKTNDNSRQARHAWKNKALDPHIWLSPPLVKKQANTIMTTLQKIDPSNHNAYQANYRQFISKIDELDTKLKQIFEKQKGLEFMVLHPSWGYFAHAYGLKQVPIEIEGKAPKPADLKELIKHGRKKHIIVIFAQPQFSAKSAKLIAREINGQVVFADPLAKDWMANLLKVAEKFKAALK